MSALATEALTTAQIRDGLRLGLERLHASHQNGYCDTSNVIATMRGWRPDLSAIGLWCLWEHIADAITRLDRIRSDAFDPADGDRELLEAGADSDLMFGIDRLTGARP